MDCIIMTYNIETMRKLFKKNRIHENYSARGAAIIETILSVSPHILGIVEASNRIGDHEYFTNETTLSKLNYNIAKSDVKRGKQDLVFYYRDPFEVISLDENPEFYDDWQEDIDNDSIIEVLKFERKPIEALFRVKGTDKQLLIILVSFKSKGVFTVSDIHRYEHLALANRKKLYAQSKKVRERVDCLLDQNPGLPILLMGDLNDELGMDHFQKQVGASAVETLTGDIHNPDKIFHNTLWYQINNGNAKEIWTTEYHDPIVTNLKRHRAWLDYIFVSPAMMKDDAPIRYIMNSGHISEKNEVSAKASDHFPVYCKIKV